jgi:hypothetical protein
MLVAQLAYAFKWPEKDILNLRISWAVYLQKAADTLIWADTNRLLSIIQHAQNSDKKSFNEWQERIRPSHIKFVEADEEEYEFGVHVDPLASAALQGKFGTKR